MKINKIYSNKEIMEPVLFKDGLNIILGDIKGTGTLKDEHNLGKTSLVHLIDFLLLKRVTKENIFGRFKNKFEGWIFFIELKLPSGKFLTIKRAVSKANVVSFKEHTVPDQDYSKEEEWDYDEMPMISRKKEDAISIFERYLNFDVATDYKIRKFLAYSLRTQYDYADIFRMPKFANGGDIDWKPFLFELLGFNNKSVIEKYKLEEELSTLVSMVKRNSANKSEDILRLKAIIAEKERERGNLKKQATEFNFYLTEKEINTELVTKIENRISWLNSERYRLEYEINKINVSLENNIISDLKEVESIFKETQIYFPKDLKKTYDDLIEFNKSISDERAKYLKDELKESSSQIEEISSELKKLNEDKSSILGVLRETNTFQKYKLLQDEVAKIDDGLVQLKQKLSNLDMVESYKKRIDVLRDEAKIWAEKTRESVLNGNKNFDELRVFFGDIFKETMRGTAVLVANVNREGNPHFESLTFNTEESEEITGKGQGYTAKKVQCASFVLALLCQYSSNNFYKFAYHDGILEGWGDGPKTRFINVVRKLCEIHDIQYIISMIKSDLPTSEIFKEGELRITLDKDKPLFGFQF